MADTSNDPDRRSRSPHRPLLASAAPSSPSTSATLRSSNLTLSPAVSAFQFLGSAGSQKLGTPLVRSSTLPISRSLSNEGHAASHLSSPLGVSSASEMQRSVSGADVMPTMSANDLPGYFAAKGKPPVDDRKKDELRKSAAIPLQNEWTFWLDQYVPNLTPAEYEQNLKIISTVGTVQAFWSVYNNIAGPDRLPFRASLHFMKKGIKPIWEDPKNENGGAYNFRIIKKDSTVGWREILMLLIGEQFEDCLSNDDSVCGVSVSKRYMSDNFQIWTTNAGTKDEEKVNAKLTQVLSPLEVQSLYYKVHTSHMAFKKPDQEDAKTAGDDSAANKEQSPRERPQFFKRPGEMPGDHVERTPEQRAHDEALEKDLADCIAAVQLKDRQDRQGMENGEAQA